MGTSTALRRVAQFARRARWSPGGLPGPDRQRRRDRRPRPGERPDSPYVLCLRRPAQDRSLARQGRGRYGRRPSLGRTVCAFPRPAGGTRRHVGRHRSISTSCGYGVPLMRFEGHRHEMERWAQAKGAQGLEAYRRKRTLKASTGCQPSRSLPLPERKPVPPAPGPPAHGRSRLGLAPPYAGYKRGRP